MVNAPVGARSCATDVARLNDMDVLPSRGGLVGRGFARAEARDDVLPFDVVARHGSGGASPYQLERAPTGLIYLRFWFFRLKLRIADLPEHECEQVS